MAEPVNPVAPNCRIAMDGRMLVHGQPTGVGTYAQGLLHAHERIAAQPLILTDRPSLDDAAPLAGSRLMRWLRALWPLARRAVERTDGPQALLVAPDIFRLAQIHFDIFGRLLRVTVPGPPGIIHWTYPVPLRIDGWANLYTIHDVIPLQQPDLSPIDHRRHRRILDRITASATGVVTVSDASAADIARELDYPRTQIHNCGQAVEIARSSAALPAGLFPGQYLLTLGSVERRKNLDTLAQAYRLTGSTMPLVVAGPQGWHAPALDGPGIVRLPYLPEDQIRALLGHACALLMPSLAEGFGLPVVEAMALGTPVMTSAGGALEEVAGGGALLVDPHNSAAMAQALRRLIDDDALRLRLAEAGRRNARLFTLDRFAAKLAVLYAEAAPPTRT
jgi:glycosyltransferase involved in cell wall biosynthesis